MGSNRQKYIHDFARTTMGQLGIRSLNFRKEDSVGHVARKLGREYWLTTMVHLQQRHSDTTHGNLAACGLGEDACYLAEPKTEGVKMCEVVGVDWLNAKYSGRLIMVRTASAALLAAMADNIWADLNRHNAEAEHYNPHRDELPERKFNDQVDYTPGNH